MCFPLIANEKYEVIDGQARLAAAERLNCPVPYIILKCVQGNANALCADVNITNDNWKPEDWIDYYADHEGIFDYVVLRTYLRQMKTFLPLEVITALLTNKLSRCKKSDIKNGQFVIAEGGETSLKDFYDLMTNTGMFEFVYESRLKSSKRLYYALIFIRKNIPQCNFKKLSDNIKKNKYQLNLTDMNTTFLSLDDIYNKGIRLKDNKIDIYSIYKSEVNTI